MNSIAYVFRRAAFSGMLLAALAVLSHPAMADDTAKIIPAPALDSPKPAGGVETAILSGGCFWGMQGVFEHVKGVVQVLDGYSGGQRDTAHYEIVSMGITGHAETIKITFDPRQVSYGQILRVYFSVAHDPTELNYQGPDSGTQYRSEIWYANDVQKRIALAYIAQLTAAHVFSAAIVTRVDPLVAFYPAEAYHQDYLIHHPDEPYIADNDLPKIENLKRLYANLYRATPVTVDIAHMPS